jgi:dUTP pyrophosphatase
VYRENSDAVMPAIAYNNTSACFDIIATETVTIPAHKSAKVPNHLRIEVPFGYHLTFKTRSSLGYMRDLFVYPGIFDTGYTGNLDIKVYNFGDTDYTIEKGHKYAQGCFEKNVEVHFEEIDKEQFDILVENSVRKDKGFGSSGK